jgi:hypothetical protein
MRHICTDLQAHNNPRLTLPLASLSPIIPFPFTQVNPSTVFTYLENQLLLLVV